MGKSCPIWNIRSSPIPKKPNQHQNFDSSSSLFRDLFLRRSEGIFERPSLLFSPLLLPRRKGLSEAQVNEAEGKRKGEEPKGSFLDRRTSIVFFSSFSGVCNPSSLLLSPSILFSPEHNNKQEIKKLIWIQAGRAGLASKNEHASSEPSSLLLLLPLLIPLFLSRSQEESGRHGPV